MKLKPHFLNVLVLLFGVSSLFAQSTAEEEIPSLVDRGNLLVGGSFTFSSEGGDLFSNGVDRQNSVSFLPSALFFVSDNIAVGGQLGYTRSWVNDASATELSIGPRAGYFYDLGNGIIPFGAVSVVYNGEWVSNPFAGDVSRDGLRASIGAGALLTIGNLGFSAELSYNWEQIESFDTTIDETFTGNVIELSVGIVGFITGK